MKRTVLFFLAVVCAIPGALRAQNAAIEERLNQLIAKVEIVTESQQQQLKRIEALERELRSLQQQSRPGASYASQEDLNQLAAKLQEIDRKRQDDNKEIVAEIKRLASTLTAGSQRMSATPASADAVSGTGYDYVVQSGDTLTLIVAAYAEKNIKVTVDQILKANPGLKPERLRIGQKIFIPAPQ
jgi:LysM repeat protein